MFRKVVPYIVSPIGCVLALMAMIGLTACANEADVASYNVSRAADQFEVQRTVRFYDSIQGRDILVVEGLCSLGNDSTSTLISVTCKIGPETYLKHFLGLSDNVTFFIEQMAGLRVDPYHYRVIFNPASLIPDIDLIGPGIPNVN